MKYFNDLSDSLEHKAFFQIAIIGIVMSILLGIVGYFDKNYFPFIITILQVIVIIIAICIKKDVIKTKYKYISMLSLLIAFVLVIFNFMPIEINAEYYEQYNWEINKFSTILPKPSNTYGKYIVNNDDSAELNIFRVSKDQYSMYIDKCKESGFAVDAIQTDESFIAFNNDGYKLYLKYENNDMYISIYTPIKFDKIDWEKIRLIKLLPSIESKLCNIEENNELKFSGLIGEVSKSEYNNYIENCIDLGFEVDVNRDERKYIAKNEEGYNLSIEYVGNNAIYLSIAEPEYDVEIEFECYENLIFSKFDVRIFVNGTEIGVVEHGKSNTYNMILMRGVHNIRIENEENNEAYGQISIDIRQSGAIKIKIHCSTVFGISAEIISNSATIVDENSNLNESDDSSISSNEDSKEELEKDNISYNIEMNLDSKDFVNKTTDEIKSEFEKMGFTNVDLNEVITHEIDNPDGKVKAVWINFKEFSKGEKFVGNEYVVISYWKYVEFNSEYELAYAAHMSDYSIYYMFDIDNNSVITFMTADTYVDKGTYTGDFISGVTMYWDHGQYVDKFVDNGVVAKLIDANGFEWGYYPCDIETAQTQLDKIKN